MNVRNKQRRFLELYFTILYHGGFTLLSFENIQTSIILRTLRFISQSRHIYTQTQQDQCKDTSSERESSSLPRSSLPFAALLLQSKSLRPKAGWAGILTSRHAVSNIPSDSLSSPHQLIQPHSSRETTTGDRLIILTTSLYRMHPYLPLQTRPASAAVPRKYNAVQHRNHTSLVQIANTAMQCPARVPPRSA